MNFDLYRQTRLYVFHTNAWQGIRKLVLGNFGNMGKRVRESIRKDKEYVASKAHAKFLVRKLKEAMPDKDEWDFFMDILDYGDKIIFDLLKIFEEEYNGLPLYRREGGDAVLDAVNPYAYSIGTSVAEFKKKVNRTKRVLKKHLPKDLYVEITGDNAFISWPYNYNK